MNKGFTKIIATLGPATGSIERMVDMIDAGVDCFRLNLSHGDIDTHARLLSYVREAQRRSGKTVAILADIQGPKLRLGEFSARHLTEGSAVWIAPDGSCETGDIPLNLESYAESDVDLNTLFASGLQLALDDGNVLLEVRGRKHERMQCQVLKGGRISSRKGVQPLGVELSTPPLTQKDCRDISLVLEFDVDFIAHSFVRSRADIELLRRAIVERGTARPRVIAKIEQDLALQNLEEILRAADGVMVARGDLGVAIGIEHVPVWQKRIIASGIAAGKTVITATQMLESMITSNEPTRAEASDVANAVFDGSAAVMLSAESAVGEFPLEAVATMRAVASSVERALHVTPRQGTLGWGALTPELQADHDAGRRIARIIGTSACEIAERLHARAIIVPTQSGDSAREVSSHRPNIPIVACSTSPKVLQQLALEWAVFPVMLTDSQSLEELWENSIKAAKDAGYVRPGDVVVISCGTRVNYPGATNTVLVQTVT